MKPTRIVGIALLRNEEKYVARSIRNAAGFCDEMLLCDHRSSDRTPQILGELAAELPRVTVHRLQHPRESHDLIKPHVGANTWILGVDGDEIYDPAGLARLRSRILSGEFKDSWTVFGNVLNVTHFFPASMEAAGHLSPPCRSMTKLYNFAAIESWDGDCVERLHGGDPVFRRGYAATSRRYLHDETPWEAADFRCLHLCFLPRSSAVDVDSRRNIMETYGRGPTGRLMMRVMNFFNPSRRSRWKNEKYRRGPETRVDVRPFFSDANELI
jgi:glycosyltransferase involved in cell wall biosynthesis